MYQLILLITVVIFAWFFNAMIMGKLGKHSSNFIFRNETLFTILFIVDLIFMGSAFVGVVNKLIFKL